MAFYAPTRRTPTLPQPEHRTGDVSANTTKPNGQLSIHFNTTHLTGDDLAERRRRAAVQEDAILSVYRKHGQLGPWQAWELTGQQWPITSVRRAINTLTKRGALVKLTAYRMGPEGAREHLWATPAKAMAA